MSFHAGELEIQERAGVRATADEVSDIIVDFVSDGLAAFLQPRRFVILGTVDTAHRVWASVITGEPGFIKVPNPQSLILAYSPVANDQLLQNLEIESHVALLAIDLLSARRVRVNGTGLIKDNAIYINTKQVYGNCRRYIQERIIVNPRTDAGQNIEVTRSLSLSPAQCAQISRTDTLFIATNHRESGADISHKGGKPGFLAVVDNRRLAIPDYNGNSMFNTLGNIQVNPRTGLLFIDFESGRTLQISGSASIDWDTRRARRFPGAERVLDFSVEEIVDNNCGFPLIVKFRQFSRFNPQST